jgi:cytoskeletal protein CcmA (bactofilin family)
MFRKFKNSKPTSSDEASGLEQTLRGGLIETPNKPTIISEGCRIEGKVLSADVMYVEGAVVGQLESVNLTIGQNGQVSGDIKCRSLSILGRFEGHAECDELSLGSHAVVNATLRYKQLKAALGAVIQGDLLLR